eukprot:360209-Chlamydomonas_euryale.AAC.2
MHACTHACNRAAARGCEPHTYTLGAAWAFGLVMRTYGWRLGQGGLARKRLCWCLSCAAVLCCRQSCAATLSVLLPCVATLLVLPSCAAVRAVLCPARLPPGPCCARARPPRRASHSAPTVASLLLRYAGMHTCARA